MTTYTAFCQDSKGEGTIWIDKVEAETVEQAEQLAREACAADWEYDVEDVHCLGLAEGEVKIVMWSDLNT